MSRFLPAPLTGVVAGLLYLLNLCIFPSAIILVSAIRYVVPIAGWRRRCGAIAHEIPTWWTDINSLIMDLTTPIEWDVSGVGELTTNGWYFVICNHQSWMDILTLQRIFNRKIPILKFFMKKQLIW